jgi:hypothetical protein
MSTAADSVMEFTQLPESSPTRAGIPKKAEGVPAWNVESIPTSSSGFLPQKAQFFLDESETYSIPFLRCMQGIPHDLGRKSLERTNQKLLNFMA